MGSSPRHFLKISMSENEKRKEVISLYKAGVQPLSIAVRLNLRAKRVMKILSRANLIDHYEPQNWGLSDQFI